MNVTDEPEYGENSDDLEEQFLRITGDVEEGSDIGINLDGTVSPELQEMVNEQLKKREEEERAAREAEKVVEDLQSKARIKYKLPLKDIHRRLSKPIGDLKQAERLSRRHNKHLISEKFIHAVLQQSKTGQSGPRPELKAIIDDAIKFGFFLFPYSVEMMKERLIATQTSVSSPRFYIIDAYAKHPDPNHKFSNKSILAADCHIQVPDARQDAALIIEPPIEGDEIHDENWVKDVLEKKPWSIASVDDIQCLRDMSGLGMAAAAMQSAMTVIKNTENANRAGFEIEHITASIATLQGISTPDGEDIRLSEHLNIAPIPNGRSHVLFDHFRHAEWSNFSTAYVLKNRRHPFEIDEKTYHIITDWWMKHSRLKK